MVKSPSGRSREFAIPSFNIINAYERYELYAILVLMFINL